MKKKLTIILSTFAIVLVIVGVVTKMGSSANSRKVVKKMNLYVATNGNDKNNGESYSNPIKTLDRLQKVMKSNASKYDIETLNVYIGLGTYYNQNLRISYYPAKKINIIGEIDDDGNKPIFTTNGKHSVQGKRTFAYIRNMYNNKYRISNISVSRYTNGIFFRGHDDDSTQGGNWLENVTCYKIGDYYSFEKQEFSENENEIGYAAIEFNYCSNNVIRNCLVNYAKNRQKHGNLIHAVYIANNSSNNRIYKSRFLNVKPDPIRIRNNSNYNRIYSNNFVNTGVNAYVSDWHKTETGETASWGNTVYRNKFYGKYNSDAKEFIYLDEIAIFKPASAKKDMVNGERLKAYKNVYITSKKDSMYNKKEYIYPQN